MNADEYDGMPEQSTPAGDVLPPNVMGEPSRPAVVRQRTGPRQAVPDADCPRRRRHVRRQLQRAQLPEVLCAVDVHKGRLRRVPPDWSSAEVPVHALYSRARHPSPKVVAFLDLVAKELRLRI